MTAPGREEALRAFDASRAEFVGAFDGVPDEALAFLKAGDDYALGGLVVHVNAVLDHYNRVFAAVVASGFGEVGPQVTQEFWLDVGRRCRDGLTPEARAEAFAELDRRHAEFVAGAQALADGDWDRKAAAFFGSSAEPYPTAPSDIWEWLNGHYLEHVPQVAELLAEWDPARAR